MLKTLEIRNFALIDHLVFNPGASFNVVTGETGAGKTIIFDALGLVLGKRADGGSLLNKESKCIIEATFKTNTNISTVRDFFEKYDFDMEEQIVLRREITPKGKSRSFINDTPASLQQLKELSQSFISIHNQHETIEIFDSDNQLTLLDHWAGTEALVLPFQRGYKELTQLRTRIVQLKRDKENQDKEYDYRQFLLKELEEFQLSERDEKLEEEIDKLSNVEEIKRLGAEISNHITNSEQGISSQLSEMDRSVLKLDGYFDNSGLHTRFRQLIVELQDLASEVERDTQEMEWDEESLVKAEERFKEYQDLLLKHNVNSIKELMDIQHTLSDMQLTGQQLVSEIERTEQLIQNKEISLYQQAEKISEKRKGSIPPLELEIHSNLRELEMPHAQIKIEMQSTQVLNLKGVDTIRVLFTANKSRGLQPLAKVASGGEASRLALVLKSLVSQQTGTLIFDEIDTGISGKVAKRVGELLMELGSGQQVISITHSPQVASCAKSHFYVYKHEEKERTLTRLKVLDKANQVKAIAEMLSGTDITDSAIANAKALLGQV